jgi:hypothetical protein
MVAAATVWINEGYERWMVVIRRCTCNEAGKTGVNRCKEDRRYSFHINLAPLIPFCPRFVFQRSVSHTLFDGDVELGIIIMDDAALSPVKPVNAHEHPNLSAYIESQCNMGVWRTHNPYAKRLAHPAMSNATE